eukprot:415486_1
MAVGSYNDSIFILGGAVNKTQLLEFNDGCFIDHGQNVLSSDTFGDAQYYTHVDHTLYMINTDGTRLQTYNMKTKSFTSSWASLPVTVDRYGCLASDTNQLYIVGGEGYNEQTNGGDPFLQAVQVLSLSTKQWLSDVPFTQVSRASGCCIADETTLYAIGGYGSGQPVYDVRSIEKIQTSNIQQQSWSYLSEELSSATYGHRCVFHNNLIYVIGGIVYWNAFSGYDTVHIINPTTGSVSVSSDAFPFPDIREVAAITVKDVIYTFGGYDESVWTETNHWTQYSSIASLPTGQAICPTPDPTTSSPTQLPSTSPTKVPTEAPTRMPTSATELPTTSPTQLPSTSPTKVPTTFPSKMTKSPTELPTTLPTLSPTSLPSTSPSKMPTMIPTTATPSRVPTEAPSGSPTLTIYTTVDHETGKEKADQNQNTPQNQWPFTLLAIVAALSIPGIGYCIYSYKEKQKQKQIMTQNIANDAQPDEDDDVEKPVEEWGVDDVYKWLSTIEDGALKELAEKFKKESVRGRVLVDIKDEHLTGMFGLALGDKLLFHTVRSELLGNEYGQPKVVDSPRGDANDTVQVEAGQRDAASEGPTVRPTEELAEGVQMGSVISHTAEGNGTASGFDV